MVQNGSCIISIVLYWDQQRSAELECIESYTTLPAVGTLRIHVLTQH